MDHRSNRHPKAPNNVLFQPPDTSRWNHNNNWSNGQMNAMHQFGATCSGTGFRYGRANSDPSIGGFLSSVKRQRDSHVVVASSQDDDGDGDDGDNYNDYLCGDDHRESDIESMDRDHITSGRTKRRRLDYAFPFDNDGRIINQQRQEPIYRRSNDDSTVIEEGVGMTISNQHEGSCTPVEWWRKKRHPFTGTLPADSAVSATSPRSIVEQETSSACSAMDTTNGDNEVCCCHVCQKFFPVPTAPAVREVMPANALLNYFSPLKNKASSSTPNGDIDMATEEEEDVPPRTLEPSRSGGGSRNSAKSPASCPCCDRPSCPECRRQCQACQGSFCVFCSVTCDDAFAHGANHTGSFCLDCYDRS